MQTRPYLPADQRRSATIEAVVALAAECNPGDITTAAIADRMGLTQGALFRHFPNKSAVWEAVMNWVADNLLCRLDAAEAGAATPLQALEALFMAHVAFVVSNPGIPRMLFGQLQNPAKTPAKSVAQSLLSRYGERLVRLLESAKASGEIAEDLDTRSAAMLFIGSIQGLVMQSLLADDVARMQQDAPVLFRQLRRAFAVRQ
ncbi:MAG: TetR/AcrR family transcriptional regulator [Arenimonas sp.]|uniref:TetR/AcrR family transcriptional regulator n=1 Tax=Arenimonas sp. TaxID=1872635 RepID=UPI0025BDA384|nr:TetR/AcrR family transcriptional regulator [Arenimonas sp.]MBW8368395.1 TetR/AcrR family transcriptional regulator [Arenimonas sp.]